MTRLFKSLRMSLRIMLVLLIICAIVVGCSESTVSTTGVELRIATIDTSTGIVTGTVLVRNSDPVPPILPGQFDTTFGTNGTASRTFENDIEVKAVAIQSNGRILVLDTITDPTTGLRGLFIHPFNNDGTIDTTFNNGNPVAIVDLDFHITAVDLAIQADGKIVVLGDFGDNALIVGRFSSTGEIDTSFGVEGTQIIGNEMASISGAALAIQEDQKIVVASTEQALTGETRPKFFSVFRLTTNGVFDSSFDDGVEIPGFDIAAEAVAVQPDGKILVVGTSETAPDFGYVLARLLTNGLPDPDFETGVLVDGLRPWITLHGRSAALQADGKILMCGSNVNTREDSKSALFIARQLTDGVTDDPFGVPPGDPGGLGGIGIYFEDRSSTGVTVAVQDDQKIVALGNSTSPETGLQVAFAARTDVYGVEDGFFGAGGRVALSNASLNISAGDMVLQDDGKALIAATGFPSDGGNGGEIVLSRVYTRGLQSLTVWYNNETPVVATIFEDGSWTATLSNIGPGFIYAKAIYTTETSTETQSVSRFLE